MQVHVLQKYDTWHILCLCTLGCVVSFGCRQTPACFDKQPSISCIFQTASSKGLTLICACRCIWTPRTETARNGRLRLLRVCIKSSLARMLSLSFQCKRQLKLVCSCNATTQVLARYCAGHIRYILRVLSPTVLYACSIPVVENYSKAAASVFWASKLLGIYYAQCHIAAQSLCTAPKIAKKSRRMSYWINHSLFDTLAHRASQTQQLCQISM